MKEPFLKMSKRLERGTIVWLIICIVIVFTPRVYMLLNPPELSYFWEYNVAKNAFNKRFQTRKPSTKSIVQLWKSCHPNELSAKDWQRLGLSPKQAASLIKYRDKYGLNSLQQMQEIRVLDQYLLNQIKDSLRFVKAAQISTNESYHKVSPTINNLSKQNAQTSAQREIKKLDLNSASIAELVALPGIGSYTAEKIIQYRQRLGGFISLNQLAEIKGVNPELVQKSASFLEIKGKIHALALNTVTIERLKQHPYLSWNQANSIIKMRQQLGSFITVEQIKQSVLIDEQTFEKLKPYLSL